MAANISTLIILSCCLAGAPADSVDELDAACPLLYVCELRRDSVRKEQFERSI